jgi:LAS superfamily LD-carboxypeptidase LdcB
MTSASNSRRAALEQAYAAQPAATLAARQTATPTVIPTQAPTAEPTAEPTYEDEVPSGGMQESFIGVASAEYETIAEASGDIDITMLVNAGNRLPDDFVPHGLLNMYDYCPRDVVKIKEKGIEGSQIAVDALLQMFISAQNEGVGDWQVSAGYRSIAYQATLFNQKVAEYQKEYNYTRSTATLHAMQYVAAPGSSEHHTGLAFDITVPGKTFAETPQCAWLAENCWRFGFIIRYQASKTSLTGIAAEPWHIRYVGVDAAQAIRRNGWCLEEYWMQGEALRP